jgi:short-subunit dehydrogenase
MATVLVIGASRGIGLEFVRQYRANGDRVIATARDDERLERLRELGAETLRVDVAQPASARGLRSVLAHLRPEDNGQLIHHDGRRASSW